LKISEVGERKLVDDFLSTLELPDGVFPLFDDTQAFRVGDQLLSFKVDTFVFSTDRPKALSPYDCGWKAVTAVASDMAAKGASPYLFACSLSLPGDTEERDAKEIEAGMRDASKKYGGYLIGGDTGEANDGVIAVAGVGFHANGSYTPRKARRPINDGDLLAVTGDFGYAPLGLSYAMGELDLPEPIKSKALSAFARPNARLRSGLALSALGAKASMDSSDGLALTVHELLALNGLRAEVEKLPTDEDLLNFFEVKGLDPLKYVFHGGEEYELVAIFPPESKTAMKPFGFTPIGVVYKDENAGRIDYRGSPIPPIGYEHFRKR